MLKAAIFVALLTAAALHLMKGYPRKVYDETYTWRELHELWTPKETEALMEMVKAYGRKPFYKTASEDMTARVQHAGEARPLTADGDCDHPYLIPSADRSMCVFPSRIDIAHHYLATGGYSAHKEGYLKLVERMLGFGLILTSENDGRLWDMPELKTLFGSEAYTANAKAACAGREVFDPIQLGIILQLPGQEVPSHYDVPWFFGATRFTLPQWLLIAMEASGLWAHLRIPQIQGVAYIHTWPNTTEDGGGFFFYPDGPGGDVRVFPPAHNTAIMVDGSQVIHGTVPFRPNGRPLPQLRKKNVNQLRHVDGDDWQVWANDDLLANYTTNDLRISLVWRSRCFKDEAEKARWHAKTDFEDVTVEEAMDTLTNDLIRRGRLSADHGLETVDLAVKIMKEYVDYPYDPNPLKRWNYCMLSTFVPALSPLLDLIC